MAAKHPQYFALFKSDYVMNREGVKSFELFAPVSEGLAGEILPVNPYSADTKEARSFEIFRQSQTTTCEPFGEWPSDRSVFDKSEVAFVLIEETVSLPVSGCYNEDSPMIERLDLKEVAIYIGEGSTGRQLMELDNYAVVYDIEPNDITIESAEVIEHAKVSGIPMLTSRRLNPGAMVLEGKIKTPPQIAGCRYWIP